MNHVEVSASLEGYLRTESLSRTSTRCVFKEVGIRGTDSRADVLTLETSYRKPDLTIYEVKASRQDLLHELKSGKWLKQFNVCNRYYFAFPAVIGRAKDLKDLLPPQVGIIVMSPDKLSWRRARVAVHRDVPLGTEILLGVIFNKFYTRWGTEIDEPREHRIARYAWMVKTAEGAGKLLTVLASKKVAAAAHAMTKAAAKMEASEQLRAYKEAYTQLDRVFMDKFNLRLPYVDVAENVTDQIKAFGDQLVPMLGAAHNGPQLKRLKDLLAKALSLVTAQEKA